MFKRNYKSQNRILRLILRFLRVYAVQHDDFNLVNPPYKNEGKSVFKFNDKSFVFPNGYVDIKRKIKSLDIFLRYTSTVNLWNTSQRWKRIIQDINKETLIMTCYNSLTTSIKHCRENLGNKISINLHLIDDGHQEEFNQNLIKLSEEKDIKVNYHKNENQGNRQSFLKCLELAKKSDDLAFFIEDDYLFEDNAIEELILSYSRIATQLNEDITLSPTDYYFYYDGLYKTSLMLGSHRKYRFVGETLMSFLTSKQIIEENYDLIKTVSSQENDPFELPLHQLYEKSPCFAPIGSLAYHIDTIAPGLSPHADWKKLWDKNFKEYKL